MLDLSRITKSENEKNQELEESIEKKLKEGKYKNVCISHEVKSYKMTEADYKKYGLPNDKPLNKKGYSHFDNLEILQAYEDILR